MRNILLFMLSFTLLGLDQQVGVVKYVQGKVYRVSSSSRDELLNKGDSVYSSDLVDSRSGKLKIEFNDDTLISLSNKTKLSIKKFIVDKNKSKRIAILKLISGDIKVKVNKAFGNNLFEINSGYISLEIKGTSFFLTKHSSKVDVVLTEGILSIKSILDRFNKLKLTENKVLSVNGEEMPKITSTNMALLKNLESKFTTLKNQENKSTKKFNSLDEGEVSSKANKYISQMRAILRDAYVTLKKVRKEKHIVKLNCVNNSVMTIKGHLRRSEDNNVSIDEALSKNDVKTSRTLLSKIYSSYNEVKQAEISMKSCDSDVIEYEGNKNVTLDVEEVIVEKDYLEKTSQPMDLSFNNEKDTQIDFEPIQASPYF